MKVGQVLGILAVIACSAGLAIGQAVPVEASAAVAVVTNVPAAVPVPEAVVSTNAPAVPATNAVAPAVTNVPAPVATNVAAPVPPHHVPVIEAATPAKPAEAPEAGERDNWLVGTRVMGISLSDKTADMGSIKKIEENQDYAPIRLFVQRRIAEAPVWVGVSYDQVSAKTLDSGGGDGDVELQGLIPYIQAGWENSSCFRPYVELGFALYQADFKENSWSDGGRRTVKLDDPTGFELAGGVDVALARGWHLDVYLRSMSIDDVKGGYYIDGRKDGPATYTMSYVGYGLGVAHAF